MSHHCFAKKPSEGCEKSPSITQIKFAAAPKTVMLLQPISSAKGINPHNYLCAFQDYLWPWNAHCIAKLQGGVTLHSFLLPQSQSMLATRQMLGEKTRTGCALLCVPVAPGSHRPCSASAAESTTGKQRVRASSSVAHLTKGLPLDGTKWTLHAHRLTLSRGRGGGSIKWECMRCWVYFRQPEPESQVPCVT